MARRTLGAATLGVIDTIRLSGTEDVAARVREARDANTPLRIVGRGHWLDAGRECRASQTLDLSALDGVIEYEPGDLTLTARAGTALSDIARVTAREGQWLTLDPFGSADGSLGATIATASAGPLASAFGTPRDHLLGCVAVTGNGDVVRAGGRVVKDGALEHGYFVRPTVLAGLPRDHQLMREELFVPIVAVEAVASLDEALARANDTKFGLTAGLFSREQADIDAFFSRIEAGVVYVNRAAGATTGAWPGVQPFGGWKGSGSTGKNIGGHYTLLCYLREQSRTLCTT